MEAPHLTALQKKYAAQGLVVLAVNAWDEPKADVAAYVRDNRLGHRILLRGSGIAAAKYGVEALPANFWINKQGTLVRRSSGFSDADLLRMEQWVKKNL